MIRKVLLVLLLSLATFTLEAQLFIGQSKEWVLNSMKNDKSDFHNDRSIKNEKYNYLKYLSDDGIETWIIVFDKEERCKAVKTTCASSLLLKKRKELDTLYTKRGPDKWSIDNGKGLTLIELKNETWYFTITYIPVPKL